jgi:hypothetical protein
VNEVWISFVPVPASLIERECWEEGGLFLVGESPAVNPDLLPCTRAMPTPFFKVFKMGLMLLHITYIS